jgi:uncharacterized protein (TIGR03435 family)
VIQVFLRKFDFGGKRALAAVAVRVCAASMIFGLMSASACRGQSPPAGLTAPDWETATGGKQAFDVATVKRNKSGYPPVGPPPHSNFPLDSGNAYSSNGGLFAATNWPLCMYIAFAYRLTPDQTKLLAHQVPKWVAADHFDIQARAEGNPTKGQMRMMMQSLLADRCNLAIHRETRQLAVYGLVLARPGKTGPQLNPRSDNLPCTTLMPPSGARMPPVDDTSGPLPFCGLLTGRLASGRMHVSARNISMDQIAENFVSGSGNLDRPVLNRTGLGGNFDFSIEFTPDFDGPPGGLHAAEPDFQADPTGPTFQEALRGQLGLKLESGIAPVDVIVVDHVEMPTEH